MRLIDIMMSGLGLQIKGDMYAKGERRGRMSSSLRPALNDVIRKVLTKAKPQVRSLVKTRYTYKGAVSPKVRITGSSGTLTVSGRRNRIQRFQYKRPSKKRQMYAEVVRGQGGTIPRAWLWRGRGTYYRRLTEARRPIKSIYGPSVGEMAGKEPEVATRIIDHITSDINIEMPRLAEMIGGHIGTLMTEQFIGGSMV